MSRRARFGAYGSAALLIVAGVVCALVLGGALGDVLVMALVGAGLVVITSLVFLEVGLSDDRARENERERFGARESEGPRRRPDAERRGGRDPEQGGGREHRRTTRAQVQRPDTRARVGRLGRMRGERRKLR